MGGGAGGATIGVNGDSSMGLNTTNNPLNESFISGFDPLNRTIFEADTNVRDRVFALDCYGRRQDITGFDSQDKKTRDRVLSLWEVIDIDGPHGSKSSLYTGI